MAGENPTFLLKPDEIQVWYLNLDNPDQKLSTWKGFLSEEEADRANQFHFEHDRRRYIARRGILRQLLGKYTNQDPGEVVYQPNPYGKLSLPSHQLKFNLSSSHNRAVFAFSPGYEVGVDLEKVQSMAEFDRMVKRWFSPSEQAGIFSLAPVLQMDAFFHVWTQKESFVKAHGEGLSMPLEDFSVSFDPNKPGGIVFIKNNLEDVSGWKMFTNIPEEGWRAAVCAETDSDCSVSWEKPGKDSHSDILINNPQLYK